MNEQIKELFMKACRHADYEHQNVPKELVDKFAELIVKECMYVGRLSQINNGLVDSDIKEHFGVE